jgi:hypothetical protein
MDYVVVASCAVCSARNMEMVMGFGADVVGTHDYYYTS